MAITNEDYKLTDKEMKLIQTPKTVAKLINVLYESPNGLNQEEIYSKMNKMGLRKELVDQLIVYCYNLKYIDKHEMDISKDNYSYVLTLCGKETFEIYKKMLRGFQDLIKDLKTPLTIDENDACFSYLNEDEKKELKNCIKNDIKLSSILFEKLKKDNYHNFNQMYPSYICNGEEYCSQHRERDLRKKVCVDDIILSEREIFDKCSLATLIRWKLFSYLTLCESVLFLFEDIIISISKKENPIAKDRKYLVIGKLFKEIINKPKYEYIKALFDPINQNLRNAIAHSDYEIKIDDDEIDYYYSNKDIEQKNIKQKVCSTISLKDFGILSLKLSILFDVLSKQIDKPFIKEIENIYSIWYAID